jgi:predicted enzyme related to lactoylglutathione lyase
MKTDFYGDLFGGEFEASVWEADGHRGAIAVNEGNSWASGGPAVPDIETALAFGVTFMVDDVDRVTARAFELGGTVMVPPFDAPPLRSAVLSDPAGAVFSISQFTPPSA